MLVAALASAVAALFALQTLSLFTVPPLVANVVVTATAIVSIGAVKSLKRKKKARLPKASYTVALTSMSSSGLAFIRVLGGKDVLNHVLLVCTLGLGLVAAQQLLESEASRIFKKASKSRKRRGRVVALAPFLASLAGQRTVDLRFNTLQQVCWLLAAVLIVAYVATRHWLLNNLIALSLAVSGLASIRVDSTQTVTALLVFSFVYDITFASVTDVMVVGGIHAPTELLFRRSFDGAAEDFYMLGIRACPSRTPSRSLQHVRRHDVVSITSARRHSQTSTSTQLIS